MPHATYTIAGGIDGEVRTEPAGKRHRLLIPVAVRDLGTIVVQYTTSTERDRDRKLERLSPRRAVTVHGNLLERTSRVDGQPVRTLVPFVSQLHIGERLDGSTFPVTVSVFEVLGEIAAAEIVRRTRGHSVIELDLIVGQRRGADVRARLVHVMGGKHELADQALARWPVGTSLRVTGSLRTQDVHVGALRVPFLEARAERIEILAQESAMTQEPTEASAEEKPPAETNDSEETEDIGSTDPAPPANAEETADEDPEQRKEVA